MTKKRRVITQLASSIIELSISVHPAVYCRYQERSYSNPLIRSDTDIIVMAAALLLGDTEASRKTTQKILTTIHILPGEGAVVLYCTLADDFFS